MKLGVGVGVNRAGFAIVNDQHTREASIHEVIRRYFRYRCEYAMGLTVAVDNQQAIRFYEKSGWVKTSPGAAWKGSMVKSI